MLKRIFSTSERVCDAPGQIRKGISTPANPDFWWFSVRGPQPPKLQVGSCILTVTLRKFGQGYRSRSMLPVGLKPRTPRRFEALFFLERVLSHGGSQKKMKEKYFFIIEKIDFEKKSSSKKNRENFHFREKSEKSIFQKMSFLRKFSSKISKLCRKKYVSSILCSLFLLKFP